MNSTMQLYKNRFNFPIELTRSGIPLTVHRLYSFINIISRNKFPLHFVFLLSVLGILSSTALLQAQSKPSEKKWGKKEFHYAEQAVTASHSNNSNGTALGYASSLYHNLISEADGDRCPFIPTCSGFFAESVRKTNLLQGLVMFADRFTRDSNPVNREGNYRFNVLYKRFDDPVDKYILK